MNKEFRPYEKNRHTFPKRHIEQKLNLINKAFRMLYFVTYCKIKKDIFPSKPKLPFVSQLYCYGNLFSVHLNLVSQTSDVSSNIPFSLSVLAMLPFSLVNVSAIMTANFISCLHSYSQKMRYNISILQLYQIQYHYQYSQKLLYTQFDDNTKG